MSVTRDDLSSVQGLPDVLRDLLVGSILSDLLLHSSDPVEDLLVGETGRRNDDVSFAKLEKEGNWKGRTSSPVKGSSKTVEGSGHGKERIRESGSDEVTGVSLQEGKEKVSFWSGSLSSVSSSKSTTTTKDLRRRFHPRDQSGW